MLDRLGECPNLFAGSASVVDEDKGVLLVGPDGSFTSAFVACKLDELSCGELDAVGDSIALEIRKGGEQALILFFAHDRILEKAAGGADFRSVR